MCLLWLNKRIIVQRNKGFKKIVLLASAVLILFSSGTYIASGQGTTNPEAVKKERLQWWLDARFGMMVHWGAYAQAGGYWKGVYEGGYSEWLKFRGIPNVEYDSLIREFNPVDFDAGEWVAIAKNAGMKYIVFTAKHHDGFAMYDSKITDYDIVGMTRFGRDPVKELAEASQKAGLKFGVYYSVDRDWHHPDASCDDRYKQCNFWDYPENKKTGAMERWHNSYFPNYALKQVEELVTRYPIDIVWFDGIGLKTRAEIALLDSIIHTNRPNCLINSRISNFVGSTDGDYGSKGDNETPGGYQAGGWENPGTLGFSYGYSTRDSFMSPRQAIHNLIEIVSKGGNYLLNVGPNGKGIIIPEARGILEEMGSWLNTYGTSIYGADGIPVEPPAGTRLTVKPHQLFVHVLNWTGGEVKISGMDNIIGKQLNGVRRVYMLADGKKRPMKYVIDNGTLTLDLASCPFTVSERNPNVEVIVVSDEPVVPVATQAYQDWKYSGPIFILTTPEGADLHVSASEKDFPLLIRLDKDFFNFSQAQAKGEDIRFTTSTGLPLAYQIEEWNPAAGASIWVRIPLIRGNDRQGIKIYWGNPDAKSESSGNCVFNESNGYLSVMHMDDRFQDEAGTLAGKNAGTTGSIGTIGSARHFREGQGISLGECTRFPMGANPSTTEAWVRAEVPNAMILGWGNEEKTGKVTMQFASPPKIRMDCYWSGANVTGTSKLQLSQWIQVVHTYHENDSRIYINGKLDGHSSVVKNPLAIKSPARMFVGGWMDDYWFSGDIDEVRVSKVTRSADWIKLQYENQKPLQTLVGPVVEPGTEFSVSVNKIELSEGEKLTVIARAAGAQKIYWIIRREGSDQVVAVDRFSYSLDADRVEADRAFILQFRAVYPQEVKTIDIPVSIREAIPEPVFSLQAPATWNGRDPVEVVPVISNLAEMKAKFAETDNPPETDNNLSLQYKWMVSGGAVISTIETDYHPSPDNHPSLRLIRSQYSGKIIVKLALNNGGADKYAEIPIWITEPDKDPWLRQLLKRMKNPSTISSMPATIKMKAPCSIPGNSVKMQIPFLSGFMRMKSYFILRFKKLGTIKAIPSPVS